MMHHVDAVIAYLLFKFLAKILSWEENPVLPFMYLQVHTIVPTVSGLNNEMLQS